MKSGCNRLCGDFKLTLNKACPTEQYPLPLIEDIFASLNGGDLFSTLDLREAYSQIPLDEESKKLTVINTHKGLYFYNRLPFGVASAPPIFQRRMETLLQGISGFQAYLDDVFVAEKNGDKSERLRQVLQVLRDSVVKLNKEKRCFRSAEVIYVGHRIDSKGLHPTGKNLEALQHARAPTNVSELRSFLGLII